LGKLHCLENGRRCKLHEAPHGFVTLISQSVDYESIEKINSHGTEAALLRFKPVKRRFMRQFRNGKYKADESRGYRLPCHVWQVDEAAWIEIRGAQSFEDRLARSRRDGNGSAVREPFRRGFIS
jgi:hypothetical protein